MSDPAPTPREKIEALLMFNPDCQACKHNNAATDQLLRLVQQAKEDELRRALHKGYFIPEMEVYVEDRLTELKGEQ